MIDGVVSRFHDQGSGTHAAASGMPPRRARAGDATAAPAPGPALDVLSDLLRCVRLTGAMLFLVEASTPWETSAPRAARIAPVVLPGARHVVSYHVVVRGSCWAGLEGRTAVRLDEGDVFVVAHGDPYFLADPRRAVAHCGERGSIEFFRTMAAGRMSPVVAAGPGHVGDGADEGATRFLCGFLGCDAQPFNPLLASLPPMLRMPGAVGASASIRHLVDLALLELQAPRPGAREALLRVSELMFVELLRRQADTAGALPGSWLAALSDPLVSRALASLHAEPARAWTLPALAARVDASRSVLAERFARVVGHPPMQYLAAWRMQLAAGMLSDRAARVKRVAAAVGYESEAAFSRAFKRATGVAPARWREREA